MNESDILTGFQWAIVMFSSIFVWALALQHWRQAYAAMKEGRSGLESWLRDGSLLPTCFKFIIDRPGVFFSLVLFYALLNCSQTYSVSLEVMTHTSFAGRWCGRAAMCLAGLMVKACLNEWAFQSASEVRKVPKKYFFTRQWILCAASIASLQALGFMYGSRKEFLRFDPWEILVGATIVVFMTIMAPAWLALETGIACGAIPPQDLVKTSLRLGKGNIMKLWTAYLGQFALVGGLVFVSKSHAVAHGAIEAISSALMIVLEAAFGAHLWAKAGASRAGSLSVLR